MPLQSCTRDGKKGFKWGDSGTCFIGKGAKKRAKAQGKAIGNMAKKSLMVHCTTKVNKAGIRRESIDGAEHIIVTSFTLPADIVMNGGLYPQSERDASFQSLEKTLAPIEHPVNSSGAFISAVDPEAIHNFHAGAFNRNVQIDEVSNRLKIDKFINVQEAKKTDRGKRLLDRIEEIETNDNARPIHTSVAAFLSMEEMSEPKTNEAGQEYTWVARDISFDHDAILLDSPAAATPSQGVGIGVNAEGEEIETQEFVLNDTDFESKASDSRTLKENAQQLSFNDIERALFDKINPKPFGQTEEVNFKWVVDVFNDHFIFNDDGILMSMNYSISNEEIQVMDFPLVVEREVSYVPKTNHEKGNAMKETIVNALKEAKIETEGLDDAALLAKYNELLANQSDEEEEEEEEPGDDDSLADVVSNAVKSAVKPLNDKIDGLEAKLNQSSDEEKTQLIDKIVASEKYPSMTKEILSKLQLEDIKPLAANCGVGHGIPRTNGDEGPAKKFTPLALVGAKKEDAA